MTDTIFAVSSGQPPAAIAVLRVSGTRAADVAVALAGNVPEPRRATLRRLRDADGQTLDRALVLWFPGPDSATGEDVLELHVHGGRAVIAAVEAAIGRIEGTRRAQPGEFTRRALLAGRIDLAEATGLADLLEAETETQRRAAMAASEGALGREVRGWLDRLSGVRAQLEAAIDYDEEGDVATIPATFRAELQRLAEDFDRRVAAPTSEQVRAGWRVVLAGPRNAGKSSLFNALLGRDAAIVAPIAGTTRDRIEVRIVREGQLFTLVDTAGLAEWTDDPIEAAGIRLSREAIATADLVLWMGAGEPPSEAARTLSLQARCDESGGLGGHDLAVSARLPETVERLWSAILGRLTGEIAGIEEYLLHDDQRAVLIDAERRVRAAVAEADPLIQAEHLRVASERLATLVGVDHTEAMLDALFSRFCIGK